MLNNKEIRIMWKEDAEKIIDAKNVINKGRKMVIFLSVCMSFVLIAGITSAWISLNKNTGSAGMNANVSVTPNLVISTSSGSIKSPDFLNTSSPTAVSFTLGRTNMYPCTHSSSFGDVGLCYVSDLSTVDPITGKSTSGTTTAVKKDEKKYYIDYVVYLASAGVEQTSKLCATLSGSAIGAVSNAGITFKAASIDYYVISNSSEEPSLGTYCTTASVSNPVEMTLKNSVKIPKNTAGCLKIVMRCYFDGALEYTDDGTTKAYIRSSTVETNNLTLNVLFEAK